MNRTIIRAGTVFLRRAWKRVPNSTMGLGDADRTVSLYFSRHCAHCEQVANVLRELPRERSSRVRCYAVDGASRADLPAYVDRVPLLVVGTDVLTDQALFDALEGMRRPPCAEIAAAAAAIGRDALGSHRFETLGGSPDGDALRSDAWEIAAHHEPIRTPDSEPMPSREARGDGA